MTLFRIIKLKRKEEIPESKPGHYLEKKGIQHLQWQAKSDERVETIKSEANKVKKKMRLIFALLVSGDWRVEQESAALLVLVSRVEIENLRFGKEKREDGCGDCGLLVLVSNIVNFCRTREIGLIWLILWSLIKFIKV
jgi:hypothetical protein